MCDMIAFFIFNSFYTSGLFNLLPQWHFWDIFQSFLPLKIDWDLMFHLGKHYIYHYLVSELWIFNASERQFFERHIVFQLLSGLNSTQVFEFVFVMFSVTMCKEMWLFIGTMERIRKDIVFKYPWGKFPRIFQKNSSFFT